MTLNRKNFSWKCSLSIFSKFCSILTVDDNPINFPTSCNDLCCWANFPDEWKFNFWLRKTQSLTGTTSAPYRNIFRFKITEWRCKSFTHISVSLFGANFVLCSRNRWMAMFGTLRIGFFTCTRRWVIWLFSSFIKREWALKVNVKQIGICGAADLLPKYGFMTDMISLLCTNIHYLYTH